MNRFAWVVFIMSVIVGFVLAVLVDRCSYPNAFNTQ
jgi:hypothetical protein